MHPNRAFKAAYNALGLSYRKAVRSRIISAGYSASHISSWLALRARVPEDARPIINKAIGEAYGDLILKIMGQQDILQAALFNSGKTTIREQRELRGLSQAQLAEACGLTQTTISKLENGYIKVGRLDTAQRISRFFSIPIDAFKEFN